MRIIIEADGQQAQTVVDALGHRLRTLGEEAQAGTGGARVAMETVTSEAKKTTTAVDETGKKLEETGARAQSGAGAAKTALEGTGAEAKKATAAATDTGKKLEETGARAKSGAAEATRAISSIEDAYRRLGMRSTSDLRQEARAAIAAYREIRQSITASNRDQEVAYARMRDTVRALRSEMASPSLRAMTTEVRRVNVEMANLRHLAAQAGTALAVAFSARAVVQLGASVLDAGRQMESLTRTFESITGSSTAARAEFQFLRQISDDLGQNFYVLADAYRGIGAAAKGTALEGQSVRDIFVAMTEASSVLGMSADSTNLAMKAIAQIMSKGKLSAEELRQQIGDHLYGAFNKAAEAMGVTTIQLEEMLQKGLIPADKFIPRFAKVLHEDFGPKAREAATGAQAATNKFREAWMDLKVSMAESGFLDSAVASMRDLTGMLQDQGVREGMRDFATLLGEIARMGASVAVELGRIGAAFNGLPPAMRGALLGAIGGGLVGFGLAGKTGALVLGGGGALLGMVAGGNASNREEVQRGMRRGAMEQRTQALIHGDVSGTVLAEGALAAEFELQAQAGSGGGGGGGGGGDGGGGGGKAKPNYEEMLRAAKDFHSAMRIMDAQALEQWKGDAAVRVDAWKAAYEAIQDITGQHVDAEVAMLRQAQDAVLSHLADNEENRLRVRAYFSQQTLDVYEREIENLQRLAINFAEFYQLELAKRSKDDERFVAHQRETWEKASKVLIELNGIDIQEDRRSLDEQYKYVREGAEDKGAADIWYQQQIQELRAKELERAEKYASDMGAVYRARVEKQLSLAASGGEEERRIWAELAEQQALLSDEVYAARAEMYKRIVAAARAAGMDEARALALVSRAIDDERRMQIEAIRDNPTSLRELMAATSALESGSYKTEFGRVQDDWRDTTERMQRFTDDFSSGIAQGFGDMARQGVNRLVEMLGPVGSVVGRLGDMFISLFEDIAAEWIRRNIMGLIFDDAEALARRLPGLAPSGGSTVAEGGLASAVTGGVGELAGRLGGGSLMFQGGTSRDALDHAWLSDTPTYLAQGAVETGTSFLSGWGGALLGVVGAGIGILGGLLGEVFGEKEKEQPPQELWSGRSVMFGGGAMGGYGYTQMSDGSYRLSALDPLELEAERQQFAETVQDINAAAKALEFDFDRNWDRDFSFSFPPVAEELAGLVERLMYSQAAATAVGDLAPAVRLFSEGLEGLDDTLIRLGDAFGTVASQVEPLGIDFARMGGVTDATLLSLAGLATGYNAGSAILRQAQDDQIESTEELTARFEAAGAAGAGVVRYFNQFRLQLQNLALASYSEQLVDAVGGEEEYETVMSRFAERAFEDRNRTEAAINFHSSEFASQLGDASEMFPGFDVDMVTGNTDAFWAAYKAAMGQAMPPSAFEWWADVAAIVSNLEDAQEQRAQIELSERAGDQELLARRQAADGQESSAEMTRRAIAMEQELADARANGLTYSQQAALAETQAYELRAELAERLGDEDVSDSLSEHIDDLKEATSYQVAALQTLASEALAAASSYRSVAETLRDTVDDLLGADMDPDIAAARAAAEFADLYRKTMSGDQEAAAQLAQAGQDLYDAGAGVGSVADYDALRASIIARMTNAAAYSERQDTWQGLTGGLAAAQSGLTDRMYDEVSSDVPDTAFLRSASDLAALMQNVSDAATLAAEGRESSATVRTMARDTETTLLGQDGVTALLAGTLDMSSVSSDQAALLLSTFEALDALGDVTGRDYNVSALMLRQLEAIASETVSPDQWDEIVSSIEAGQDEYIEWLRASIESSQSEADRLYALQEQQLAATEAMEDYFAGISQYLLRQTQIETLSEAIADLQSQASSYQSMAAGAMMMGVPVAAAMHLQSAASITAQIASLRAQLDYWLEYQPDIPQLAAGGIGTSPSVVQIAEGGVPEAIVPLDKFWAALDNLAGRTDAQTRVLTGMARDMSSIRVIVQRIEDRQRQAQS